MSGTAPSSLAKKREEINISFIDSETNLDYRLLYLGYGGYNNDYSSYTGGVGGGGGGGWMTGTQVGSQASQASPGSSSKVC